MPGTKHEASVRALDLALKNGTLEYTVASVKKKGLFPYPIDWQENHTIADQTSLLGVFEVELCGKHGLMRSLAVSSI